MKIIIQYEKLLKKLISIALRKERALYEYLISTEEKTWINKNLKKI